MTFTHSLLEAPSTRKPLPSPLGPRLPAGTCPQAECHRAQMHYSTINHAVTCGACFWHAVLTPKEQRDIALFLVWPEALPLADFLAAIARRVAQPDPTLLYNRAEGRGHKNIAPPRTVEGPWGRLMRLGEQAHDANSTGVELVQTDPQRTVFRAESQRTDATGQRVHDPYRVVVDDRGVHCECPAGATAAPCGHVGNVYLWCLEQQAATLPVFGAGVQEIPTPAPRPPAEVRQRAQAAVSDLWGDD